MNEVILIVITVWNEVILIVPKEVKQINDKAYLFKDILQGK